MPNSQTPMMKRTLIPLILTAALLGIGGIWLYATPFPAEPTQITKQPRILLSSPQTQPAAASQAQQTPASQRATASSTHQIDSLVTNLGATASLIIGATNSVLIVADISDPAVIPASVNLFQQTSSGSPILVGVMHDDGLNGDLVAGDGQYTLAINGTFFSAAGTYALFATAAFRNTLLRGESTPVDVTVSPPMAIVDTTWRTYQDPQFNIETPDNWIAASSTSAQNLPDGATRWITFSLPSDSYPALYIYVYPHGYRDFSHYDEPPSFLGTNNQYDFYFIMRGAPADPTVLAENRLTDTQFHNDILQALATFHDL